MTIPSSWMPSAPMKGIVAHWSAGDYVVDEIDREHYHLIVGGNGKWVRGDHEISDNVNTADDDYAGHTRKCNTGFIGVAMACMRGAIESPFNPGDQPMTRLQWDTMVDGIAQLCGFYNIRVTPKTVLSHAEVQGTLGIQQRGKWDFTRLPFDPSIVGAEACGDKMRNEVLAKLGLDALPTPPPPVAVMTWRVAGVAPDTLTVRFTPNGEQRGELPEDVIVDEFGREGQWVNIRTPAGHTGWVFGKYLEKVA